MNPRKLTAQLFALLLLAGAAGAFFGCETTEGAGEDLQDLGENIEDSSEENDGDNN